MDRARSLKANVFWQFVTNGMAAVAQLAIVTALTKCTSKAVTGEFTFAWSLCTPVFMFAGLDLRTIQATDTRNEFSFVDQFAIRLLTGLMAGLVSLGVVLVMGWPGDLLCVVAAVSCGKYCELVAETFVGLMQRHERFELVTRSTAIRAIVSCLSMSIAVLVTRDLVLSSAIWAVCGLLNLALVEIPWGKQFLSRISENDGVAETTQRPSMWQMAITRSGLDRLLRLGLPLAFRSLLVSMTPSVARFFVAGFLGFAALGIFGPIAQLTMAAILFSRTLNPAMAPRLSRYLRDGQFTAFRKLLMQVRLFYAGLGVSSLVFVAVCGRWLLGVWFTPEYANYHSVFIWAMVATATLFQGGVLDMALVIIRRVDSLATTALITLGTMCVSGFILTPLLGLDGASIAVALSWAARGLYLQFVLTAALRDAELSWRPVENDRASDGEPVGQAA